MVSLGIVALLGLALLVALALLAGLAIGVSRGRWGWVLGLGAVLTLPLLIFLVMIGSYSTTNQASTSHNDSYRYVQHTIEAADEELAEVISDKPSIQLDIEQVSDDETASENAAEEAEPESAEANSDLPDWIDARAKLHDKVFAAGPFVTPAQCEEDTRRQILAWLAEKAGVSPPAESVPAIEATLDDVVRRTHLSKRETSVGTVYLQYTRAHSDAEVVETIRQEVQNLTAVADRQRGRNRLVLGGGLLLGVVGLLHGFLRSKLAEPSIEEG